MTVSPTTTVAPDPGPALRQAAPDIAERRAEGVNGLVMLLGLLVAGILAVVLIVLGAAGLSDGSRSHGGPAVAEVLGWALVFLTLLASLGLTAVAPGQARVVTLLGRYKGTIRTNGLRWVNPFTRRTPISTRIRNLETAVAKVNDADGNPVEIAAVVVWHVEDTARASFAVDDFARFVAIQSETAVRHVATSYPYDAHGGERYSLRENAEEITAQLSSEIAVRVAAAGVRIVESRITQLSYAPEIASAMLRRQQASAVVAARSRIVEGAVGMVKLALQGLSEQGIVELDEERKAAMVSNLLVVLCADRDAQPIVNTSSLYQ